MKRQRRRSFRLAAFATAAVSLLAVASVADAGGNRQDDGRGHNGQGKGGAHAKGIDLQILAINDFHGALDYSSSSFGGGDDRTGGSPYLASHLRKAEAEAPGHSITVSAGDLIGASPLVSALFHDEPTIEAANLFGLEINAVGNHEFDEGGTELLRMQNGGSHPVDTDLDGDGFDGAEFEFLAANVVVDDTGETIFPAYTIKQYGDYQVAFIGMTLEGTPNIVTPSGVAGLTFNDEVQTVNALVPQLQAQGIRAIVVLLHEGGFTTGDRTEDDCGDGLVGPLADIVPALDDEVDIVIAGHTNSEFVCMLDGKLVTMADNNGRLYTDIDVRISEMDRDITVIAVDNVPTRHKQVEPDAAQLALIDKYQAIAKPLANAPIGMITADIPEFPTTLAGESSIGDLIADAQLAATTPVGLGEAVITFMNPGGIRTDDGYLYDESAELEGDGVVTYGEAFAVQPFGNSLVTMTLTGAQIDELLEQQEWPSVDSLGEYDRGTVLQVSNGFTYTWDYAADDGDKVDPATIKLNGVTLDPLAGYRVTVNSFLSDGGDGFSVLVEGTDRLGGAQDIDSMVDYFAANPPIVPPAADRITVVNFPPQTP